MKNRVWNILLIDDDEDEYILTRELLASAQMSSYQLSWATTFNEGLRFLEDMERPFDAVLVDYDLGAHNGIELIRTGITMDYPAPFILLTGRGSFEIDMEAMNAGASVYLTKTEVNPLLLERSIRYAMERKQAEQALRATNEALRASEERFKAVLENSLDVAYRRNVQTGHYDYLSPVIEQMSGFTVDEMRNMSIKETTARIHPQDREQADRQWRKAVHTGKGRLEFRFQNKDGSYQWLADHITIEYDDQGQPLFRTGIVRDMSIRKRTEQAMREREARERARALELQTFMDAAPAYVWIARDAECQVMTGNQATYQLLGMPEGGNISKTAPHEEMPRKFRAFRNGEELSPEELPMQVAASTGEPVWGAEYEMVFEDGQRIFLSGNAAPLFDANGQPAGAVGVFLDVTFQKTAEHQRP